MKCHVSNEEVLQTNGASSIEPEGMNGRPTHGKDPITSTEEFLSKYKDVMEKTLASMDEKLEDMDTPKPMVNYTVS